MTASLTPELCIIGAGSGGLALAGSAAASGLSTVVVEKGELGGRPLHHGGLPSKALIAAGHAARVMRTAERFGIRAQEPRVDYSQTRACLRAAVASAAPGRSAARMQAMNVKVIRAAARFVSKKTVEAGGSIIEARRFVVATGSSPAAFPIRGLEQIRSFTTESIFDLTALPTRLVVIGTAKEGLELGQAFRRLGCEVTILEPGVVLADEDPELAEILLVQLAREGIILRQNVEILRVEPHGPGVRVVLAGRILEETVDGSHLLIAAGRTPNVEGLGLEAAGIIYDNNGIKLDCKLRSSNPRVFAVGDVGGAPFSAAAANYQAAIVLRSNFLRRPGGSDLFGVPRVTFTDPEIAVAGMRETEAHRRYGAIRVLRWPFSENDRARAECAVAGHIKVILSKRDTILGAGIVGPHASELIAPWQLAICNALKIEDMANSTMAYPTFSEVSQRVAATAHAARLRKAWTSGVVRLTRAFG